MSKTRRLSELTDEVRKLCILQGIDMHKAFSIIRDDERFVGLVTLSKIQVICKQLEKECKNQPSIETFFKKKSLSPNAFNLLKEDRSPSSPFYNTDLHCDHEIEFCLKFARGFSKDGCFVLYNIPYKSDYNGYGFLLYDILNNKCRYIKARKSPDAIFNGFHFLNDKFGLLFEKFETRRTCLMNLVELDWVKKEMRTIQTYDSLAKNSSDVLIDPMHPEKVVFARDIENMRICLQFFDVVEGAIVRKRTRTFGDWPKDVVNSAFDGKLYCFNHRSVQGETDCASIHVAELNQDSPILNLAREWPSKKFRMFYLVNKLVCCWVRNRFYAVVRLEESGKLGIAWISCETLDWTLIKFSTVECIIKLQFVVEENVLLVQTVHEKPKPSQEMTHQIRHNFHRIQIKKPDSLSNLAWCSLVKLKSKISDINPYEEALKYLPYTSEIRCPFDN